VRIKGLGQKNSVILLQGGLWSEGESIWRKQTTKALISAASKALEVLGQINHLLM